jgi:hypothetical protein
MNTAYEKLIEHLDGRQYRYTTDDGSHSVFADFRGEVGHYRLWIEVTEEAELFQIFGHSGVRIPPGSRPDIAEVVTRANCGMRVGKFEMNIEEGEIRFQAAHILTGGELEPEVIDRLISTTLAMLDRYVPAILSVIYGNEPAADAVKRVEADMRPKEDENPPTPPEDLPF